MKKILLGLLMIGTLFGQVNRVLTISPTTSETILGNQSLAFRNPAMNLLNTDTTTEVSFTNVKWLGNIVDDMGFNYVQVKRGKLDYSLLYFDYGAQNIADDAGIISGTFTPNSIVASVGWGTNLLYKGEKIDSISIGFRGKVVGHSLHTEKTEGMLFDTGLHFHKLYGIINLDFMVSNIGIMTKINGYEPEIPASVNVGFNIPIKNKWTIYNQWKLYENYHTHGQGVSYNWKNMLWVNAGYYNDVTHQLNYSSVGLDFKIDKYKIGVGMLNGSETHPLKETLLLTLNVEI